MGKILKALLRLFCCGGWERDADDEQEALAEETTDGRPSSSCTAADNAAMRADEETVEDGAAAVTTTVQRRQVAGKETDAALSEPASADCEVTVVAGGTRAADGSNQSLLERVGRLMDKLEELNAECRALVYEYDLNRIRRENGLARTLRTAATPSCPRQPSVVPPTNDSDPNGTSSVVFEDDDECEDDDDDEDGDEESVDVDELSPVPSVVRVVEYDDPPPPIAAVPSDGSAVRHMDGVFWIIYHPAEPFTF